jgi:hypothetical protein
VGLRVEDAVMLGTVKQCRPPVGDVTDRLYPALNFLPWLKEKMECRSFLAADPLACRGMGRYFNAIDLCF